jgi:hypothetical protein
VIVLQAADGQSADRFGSLQLRLLSFKAGPAGGSDTRELDGEPPGNTPITEGELLNLSSQPGAAMRR